MLPKLPSHWQVFANAEAVAAAACTQILTVASQAIAARGQFRLVLAGGRTPEQCYRLLAQADAQWAAWHLYYGDERCLPAAHPDRNSQLVARSLGAAFSLVQHHPIPAELGPTLAAERYTQSIATALPFDLVLLGMGEDGHTASLFPGHPYPAQERVHAVQQAPKPPPQRVSLSAATLSQTRHLLFLITGSSKTAALRAWQAGAALPVAQISPAIAPNLYLDQAAWQGTEA